MPASKYIKLRGTNEYPEVRASLFRLSLKDSIHAIKSLYPFNQVIVLKEANFGLISENDMHGLETLYSIMKKRVDGNPLDPRGYLEYVNHNDSYKILEQIGKEMPSPLTFIRKLEALMLGIDNEITVEDERGKRIHPKILQKAYDDIAKSVDPWRGEWLNAGFEITIHQRNLIQYFLNKGKKLEKVVSELDPETLMELKTINLKDLVRYHTPQGLPRKDIPEGTKLRYWPPRDKYVARFDGGSGGTGLGCGWYPAGSGAGLGIAPCTSQKFLSNL